MNEEAVTDLTHGIYRRLYSGFIKGQRINKLSLQAEAWFWRLVATVDDFGNGDAEPELCRATTAGRRKVTASQVGRWLDEMEKVDLISFYEVEGERFLHICGFEESQPAGKTGRRIRRFASSEKFCASGKIRKDPEKSGAVTASYSYSEDHDHDHSDNHPEDDNDNENHTSRSRAALVDEVFQFWRSELNHPKSQLTTDRKARIEQRLKDSTLEEIKAAIKGCKLSDFHMGRELGHPKVFDDIELICRKRSKLEFFIAIYESSANGATNETSRPTANQPEDRASARLHDNLNFLATLRGEGGPDYHESASGQSG